MIAPSWTTKGATVTDHLQHTILALLAGLLITAAAAAVVVSPALAGGIAGL